MGQYLTFASDWF